MKSDEERVKLCDLNNRQLVQISQLCVSTHGDMKLRHIYSSSWIAHDLFLLHHISEGDIVPFTPAVTQFQAINIKYK